MVKYKFKKIVLQFISKIRFYKWPLWLIYIPKEYNLTGKDYRKINNVIKPGDILLRKYDTFIDSYLIPGKWDHVAVYLGRQVVVHAVSTGVEYIDLIDFCRCDQLLILRPKVNINKIKSLVRRAASLIGKEYDTEFNFGNYKKFVCTELVYYLYGHTSLKIMPYKKFTWFKYRKVLIPDDFLKANVKIISWEK